MLSRSLTKFPLFLSGNFVFDKGKGVKQDDFKALKFYQKACGLNDGSGCYNLV